MVLPHLLPTASTAFGLVAAGLWFRASRIDFPLVMHWDLDSIGPAHINQAVIDAYMESIDAPERLRAALSQSSRLNGWAAALTFLSVIFGFPALLGIGFA